MTLPGQGFIVVIPDYRKYPAVCFPAFVEDAARALSWTHDRIADYGGAPDRLFLSGHSAGAHIAALLTFDERYGSGQIIQAFAGLAGPYAFVEGEGGKVRVITYPGIDHIELISTLSPLGPETTVIKDMTDFFRTHDGK